MLANQYKLVVIDNTAKAHLDDVPSRTCYLGYSSSDLTSELSLT